jgi:hypothetical protein
MSTTIIIALFSLFTALGSSFITFLFTKKKNKAETLSVELDNARKVIEIWRELSEEQSERIKVLEIRIDDLQNDMETIKSAHEEQCNSCNYKKFYLENNK